MPSTRQLRRRIRSVQSTAKITKAMEMIAASKMRRAQQRVTASRPYAEGLMTILADITSKLSGQDTDTPQPLLAVREPKRIGVILFTPNRGLTGGLNANTNRAAGAFALQQTVPTAFVAVGKKGRDYMNRFGREVIAEFTTMPDFPTMADILPVAHIVRKEYEEGSLDRVFLIYPRFLSTAVQRPHVQQLLPIQPPQGAASAPTVALDYVYEPDPATVLTGLLPRLVEMTIYEALLETVASEQSARMVAMHAATDAAKDMIQSLTLAYNKARQETITKELLDLVGGVAALENA